MRGIVQTVDAHRCFHGRSLQEPIMTLQTAVETTESGSNSVAVNRFAWNRSTPPATLVIGFGNVGLGDDGAGIHLVELLRSELALSACEFMSAGTHSLSLLPHLEATNALLLISATQIDRPPGTLAIYEGTAMDQFLKGVHVRSVHEVGMVDLLNVARARGSLPRRLALLCIQPGTLGAGAVLSTPVAATLDRAAIEVRALLQQWKVAVTV
jgi:hydrogenase maturation protease